MKPNPSKSKAIRHKKIKGTPPGSVIYTGRKAVTNKVHYLRYNAEKLHLSEFAANEHNQIKPSNTDEVDWYDVRGLSDTGLIERIGKTFSLHPLLLEDIADVYQRPKFEEYDAGVFIILKALHFNKERRKITTEQVSIFFSEDVLISFQESEEDLFYDIRQRIQNDRGRIRRRGTDYLAYALLDNIVDNYYIVLDEVENLVEQLEEAIILKPTTKIKQDIHSLKRELLVVRKSISPLREAVSRFTKTESPVVADNTLLFVRDLYDHTIQIMDSNETYRDMLNSLQDLYLSEISFKMNQVMQVLTIITTIFVPLGFLAGIYGMNFEYIPELQFRYGYFVLLGVMLTIVIGSLLFFRNKKWL